VRSAYDEPTTKTKGGGASHFYGGATMTAPAISLGEECNIVAPPEIVLAPSHVRSQASQRLDEPAAVNPIDTSKNVKLQENGTTTPMSGYHFSLINDAVEDAFPLLQKSSTEDAIVSVHHHPVFQKRISAEDSTVGGSKSNRRSLRLKKAPRMESFRTTFRKRTCSLSPKEMMRREVQKVVIPYAVTVSPKYLWMPKLAWEAH
jgi:hypothetical protein